MRRSGGRSALPARAAALGVRRRRGAARAAHARAPDRRARADARERGPRARRDRRGDRARAVAARCWREPRACTGATRARRSTAPLRSAILAPVAGDRRSARVPARAGARGDLREPAARASREAARRGREGVRSLARHVGRRRAWACSRTITASRTRPTAPFARPPARRRPRDARSRCSASRTPPAHFGAALHWLEFGPALAPAHEAELLLELGRAHLLAGDSARAAQDLAEAARVARDGDALEPLARAVVELAAMQPANAGASPRERIALVEHALLQLPPVRARAARRAPDRARGRPGRGRSAARAHDQRRRDRDRAPLARSRPAAARGLEPHAASALPERRARARVLRARRGVARARRPRPRRRSARAPPRVRERARARGSRRGRRGRRGVRASRRRARPPHAPRLRGDGARRARALARRPAARRAVLRRSRRARSPIHRSRELAFLVGTVAALRAAPPPGAPRRARAAARSGRCAITRSGSRFQCALALLYATTGRDDDARASLVACRGAV